MIEIPIFLVIFGAIVLFVLGVCCGSMFEIGSNLRQLKHEIFETDRDIETLKKMEKEYGKSMRDLKDWQKKYEDAYAQAMDIITEASYKQGGE